jgi:hypothetical protein
MGFETHFSCTKPKADQKLAKLGPHERNADPGPGSYLTRGEKEVESGSSKRQIRRLCQLDAQIPRISLM